ncbi:MAG: hypothetical protein WDA53_09960 [Bacillota bacterium]
MNELVNQVDEAFSQVLLRLIDKKCLTDSDTYKRSILMENCFSKLKVILVIIPVSLQPLLLA